MVDVEVWIRPLDSVVGDAVLGVVVRPDLLRPLARANHRSARLGFGLMGLALLQLEQSRAQDGQRFSTVLVLALLVLDRHHEAGRNMGDAHRRVGRVDALAPRALRPINVDLEVLLVDLDLDLISLRQHGHGRSRRVDASARLGLRHALDAMHAALELQPAVRALPAHLEDHLTQAADARLVRRDQLGLPCVALGVAAVHPVQGRGEEGGFFTTGTGADLHDHVPFVTRIDRQEVDAQRLGQARLFGFELGHDRAGKLALLGIRFVAALETRRVELATDLAKVAIVADDGDQLGLLTTKPARPVRIRGDAGLGPLFLDLLQPLLECVETQLETHGWGWSAADSGVDAWVGIGRRSGSRLPAGASSPFAASASRIDAMATSIIESSG